VTQIYLPAGYFIVTIKYVYFGAVPCGSDSQTSHQSVGPRNWGPNYEKVCNGRKLFRQL